MPAHCTKLKLLQILSTTDSKVIGAGRPVDDFQELSRLQGEYKDRLTIVKLELLQLDTIQARHRLASSRAPTLFASQSAEQLA